VTHYGGKQVDKDSLVNLLQENIEEKLKDAKDQKPTSVAE